jgi:hypothetical protein
LRSQGYGTGTRVGAKQEIAQLDVEDKAEAVFEAIDREGSAMRCCLGGLLVAALLGQTCASKAQGCDQLAGRLLTTYLDPAIKGLGCSALGKAGVDNADHKLESVCYTSTGPTSQVVLIASLRCHTSDAAFIPVSISERVTAEARVRAADCSIEDFKVQPSGEIGKVLSAGFDLNGRARSALQDGLNKICSGKL